MTTNSTVYEFNIRWYAYKRNFAQSTAGQKRRFESEQKMD